MAFVYLILVRAGGAMPVADSRAIYWVFDPVRIVCFSKRQLLYVRNFGKGLICPGSRCSAPAIRA